MAYLLLLLVLTLWWLQLLWSNRFYICYRLDLMLPVHCPECGKLDGFDAIVTRRVDRYPCSACKK